MEELSRLVGHLSERLAGAEDGRPKVFRDSAVGNLREFFERFKALNVGSSAELDRLVCVLAYLITRPIFPLSLAIPLLRGTEQRDPRKVTAALLQ